jgi:tetratricopeptide (TPR) repeat protein
MANKYKKINQAVKRQRQDDSNTKMIMGIVGVALIAVVVLLAYGGGKGNGGQAISGGSQPQNIGDFQQRVQTAEKAAQANPKDYNAQKSLGDAYYDLGSAYQQGNKDTEAATNYGKAVEPYQKALEIKFEVNVQTDMATAAFYGNQLDVAESAFKKAIEKEPNFMNAQLNYGIFLRDARSDKGGAKKQFEIVAKQTKDSAAANKAKGLLSSVQ